MSAIGTVNSYSSDISSLLANSDSSQTATTAAPPTSTQSSGSGSDAAATRVDLSDKVKAILARANTDQDVAERLKALVQSHRSNTNGGGSAQDATSSSGQSSSPDVNQSFEQLTGGAQAAAGSQDYAPVNVATNFATGLKADGYTISAVARASDGSFQVELVGPDGKSFLDRRFGTSGEVSTFGGISAGGAAQSYQQGNKEYITFSQSSAAAVSVGASSDAGTISASSVGAHTESTTFVVDFSTGAISMLQSESTSVSTIASASQPGSGFSALA